MTRAGRRALKVAAALTVGVAAILAWSLFCAWLMTVGGVRV